ncbi:MAG: tetratricopeptide repeat protein [Cyanobacteriota/Melainabacteria group bacterium]
MTLSPDESLGLLLQGQGQLDEALHQYNEAIKLRPDVPLLRLNFGIALRVRDSRRCHSAAKAGNRNLSGPLQRVRTCAAYQDKGDYQLP